jgi:hypothetical protein
VQSVPPQLVGTVPKAQTGSLHWQAHLRGDPLKQMHWLKQLRHAATVGAGTGAGVGGFALEAAGCDTGLGTETDGEARMGAEAGGEKGLGTASGDKAVLGTVIGGKTGLGAASGCERGLGAVIGI